MRKYGRRKMQQSKKLELDGRTHQDEELRLNSRSVKQKLEKAKKVQKKCNVPLRHNWFPGRKEWQ